MTASVRRIALYAIAVVAVATLVGRANAHFLWLKSETANDKLQGVLLFGESPFDEAYHLPASLAETEIFLRTPTSDRILLASEKVENDDRIGLVAVLDPAKVPPGQPWALEAVRQYGVYGEFLLTYYTKHIHADANDALTAIGPSPELKLDLVPRATADGLEFTVLWDGKSQAGVELTVTVDENDSEKVTTDADGKATLNPTASGLVSVLGNTSEEDKKGSLNGKDYTSGMNYVSLTFPWQKVAGAASKTSATESSKSSEQSIAKDDATEKAAAKSALPLLPEAVSSFGAVVSDGWLYVYGGHTGQEHDHSAANLSQKFSRIKIDGTGGWESLPMQTPLQGLSIVAHGGKIYRVGGMNARNATTNDKEDLHSTNEFAVYDPAASKWTDLVSLPAARSSHNAAIIGDKLYVTGGWTLSGPREGKWLTDSLVYDFSDPSKGWQKLPEQSFQRRALAAGQWQGKLVALGGMDETAEISQRVDLFDPQSGKWSRGPDLPGAGMAGFGVSAWNLDGNLYVSGFRGQVFRLSNDGSAWEEVARLATPRFFHQLVPAGKAGGLFAVGGASRDGHLADIELIEVASDAAANDAAKSQTQVDHAAGTAADARPKSSGSAGI